MEMYCLIMYYYDYVLLCSIIDYVLLFDYVLFNYVLFGNVIFQYYLISAKNLKIMKFSLIFNC